MMTMTTMIISTIMMTMITTVTEMIILKFNVLTVVKTLWIDFDMIDDDNAIVCPNCHEEIELEFDCDCDDDDSRLRTRTLILN